MHKYKNPKTGKIEEVEEVDVQWEAVYRDGTFLKQYSEGLFHQIAEIDQSHLAYLIMRNTKTGQRVFMEFPDHAKLVHFYLNEVQNAGTKNETKRRAFVFGIERPTNNYYFVISFNGDIAITSDYNKVNLHTGSFNKK